MSASAFPPPPPYYRLYNYGDDSSSAPSPPAPVTGTYVQYGGNYTVCFLYHSLVLFSLPFFSPWKTMDVLTGLEEEGLRQLYPTDSDVDFKRELRALNRELILQFLELTDALIERPFQSARCVEDITLILRNTHYLLNSLRPHQARATVIHMLETQSIRRKEALADIRRKRAEARGMLQEFSTTL
ncbi:hypothetical protein KC19_VG178500 [Ceratodon purpureus]|uniref:Mediator of RNA polymerase II transcription subunit 7 n=1 Tax=Ceratodon purpureus TaxID=3225 RepID=A0A8T0HSB3_CERPU|nr:hypothetical protein KC19_VG178500 [Ceratodon purpureus]